MSAAIDAARSFLAMGGYGGYVWLSFGLTAAAIAGELIGLRARRQALQGDGNPVDETDDQAASDLHTRHQASADADTAGRPAAMPEPAA